MTLVRRRSKTWMADLVAPSRARIVDVQILPRRGSAGPVRHALLQAIVNGDAAAAAFLTRMLVRAARLQQSGGDVEP